jgi:hypothetical protein
MTSMALFGVGLARASEFSAETVALAVVDLLPADPIPQRLGVHPQPLGDFGVERSRSPVAGHRVGGGIDTLLRST